MLNRAIPLLLIAAAAFGLAGCAASWFSTTLERFPPQERADFDLVEVRCSQCHGMEKLQKLYRRSTERLDWELEVEDMAAREGSRIRPDEHGRLADMLYKWSQSAER